MKRHDKWVGLASCARIIRDSVFMESAWINEKDPLRHAAENICESCPVRMLCLEDALDDVQAEGLRGGFYFSSGALVHGERSRLKSLFPRLVRGREIRTRQSNLRKSAKQKAWDQLSASGSKESV